MKKIWCALFLGTCIGIASFSIGLTFGPFANEQYLIEHEGQFNVGFYDFPLFLGGIYHKIHFSPTLFYYIDLTCNIHNASFGNYADDGINMHNYIFYFHQDLNFFPFHQKWVYMGAGMELIVVDRVFSGKAQEYTELNFYVSTNYFCYMDCGIRVSLGKIELGVKALYRIAPLAINSLGNGEITFLIGLK